MTILANDIKLLQSDNMSDVSDGGGAMTGNVILDGVSNNIFDDISTLDRVYGAVHMRKLFAAIQTVTTDKFFGSMVLLSKLPKDNKIGVNLFSTGDWFDRRQAAQQRVEAYRVQASQYQGFIWGTQYAGSRTVTLYQNPSTSDVPNLGDVFMISNTANTGQSQYVRVTKVATNALQTFTDSNGSYQRRVITLQVATPLLYDYIGSEIQRLDVVTANGRLFNTVVANAAKYYSARPLKTVTAVGDLMVKVDSVYSQVIPSSQAEVALLDLNAGGYTTPLVVSGVPLTFTSNFYVNANKSLHLGNPCMPGTFSMTLQGYGITLTDSAGQIKSGTTTVGTIDYVAGIVNFSSTCPSYPGSNPVTYTPAGAPVVIADTASLSVTAANRGYIWTINIAPPPAPGALTVSYRALGKWYSMRDNSTGGIIGLEAGIGSGSINYVSGSISITTSVLPDVDSEIIFSWGAHANKTDRSATTIPAPKITKQLAHTGIAPGTLVITWNDGTARTATANTSGVITGAATGKLSHSTGVVEFTPTILPLGGQTFTFNYQFGTPILEEFTHPARNTEGKLVITLANQNILPNSMQIQWNTVQDISVLDELSRDIVTTQTVWKDPIITATESNGKIKTDVVDNTSSLDIVNGIISFNPDRVVKLPKTKRAAVVLGSSSKAGKWVDSETSSTKETTTTETYRNAFVGFEYVDAPAIYPNDDSGWVKVSYRAADTPNTATETLTLSSLQLDLTPDFAETIVYGSVRFDFGGKTYVDRNGQLFTNINNTTGAGDYAGTIDYSVGTVNISNWSPSFVNIVALRSLLTDMSIQPVDMVTFRLPTSPIRQGSLQIRATAFAGGAHLTATADMDGVINTSTMFGYINYETGVVQVRFGAWVVPTGHESESWFDPAAIVGTGTDAKIFKPMHVMAESIIYNAVSYTYIPLSSSILGLDPVRLPPDGRVPIYSTGDVAVILNDKLTVGTFTNGTTTNLNRVRLAKVVVKDHAGNMIAVDKYSVDLDAGTITWNNLSGVSQPISIIDRIEDMGVITDVQITGQITLSQPLTHAFPLENTLVSNAVINGTIYARTSVPFDQQTWTNVWTDSATGSTVAAQYNNSQFPIVVDNQSAIQERWALIFTTASLFNVVGEHVGQIVTGANTNTNTAPINPNTSLPYFTIPANGWGSGWSAGNVLRFNTYAANAPVWIIQSIGQGAATDPDFTFCIEARGDIDNVA